MALILNPFLKTNPNGIMNSLRVALGSTGAPPSTQIAIFPSTVPFPALAENYTSAANGTVAPAGAILVYSQLTLVVQDGQLVIGNGNTSATPSASGTASWFMVRFPQIANRVLISDSIGLLGTDEVLTLSTLSLTAGSPVSVALNLASI